MSAAEPSADQTLAADFVRRFEEFWRSPAPEKLGSVLADPVLLLGPLTSPTKTRAEAEASFASLFALIPDMSTTVDRWGQTRDGVMIEFTVNGSAAGRAVSWRSVDRFSLDPDGLASERETYFDSLPLVLAAARHPRAWPGFARTVRRRG